MRNWNRIPPIGFSWMDMALPDYLWGIETCIHQFLLGHFLELPDYLWGIETRPWVPVLNIKGLASRLPMRNWNALAQITDPSEGFSFQTTYEELKLDCYLTTTWQSASFQTTYEELKLLQETGERFSSTASRLPMRNWNSCFHRFFPRFSTLPDYLWGIETCICWCC